MNIRQNSNEAAAADFDKVIGKGFPVGIHRGDHGERSIMKHRIQLIEGTFGNLDRNVGVFLLETENALDDMVAIRIMDNAEMDRAVF